MKNDIESVCNIEPEGPNGTLARFRLFRLNF